MIRHVVVWKISDDAAVGRTKEEIAEELTLALGALPIKIPSIRGLIAGPNCVEAEGNWDLGLIVDFPNQEALNEYAVHPAHLKVVEKIKAVVSARAAIDLEI